MTSDAKPIQKLAHWPAELAPTLLAWTPILFAWGRNYQESRLIVAAAMLGVATLVAAAVLGLLFRVIPDRDRRALGASVVLVFLLFYGFLFQLLWKRLPLSRPWMLHVPLGLLLTGIGVAVALLLRKATWNAARAVRALILALGLVSALSTVQVVRSAFREKEPGAAEGWEAARIKSQSPVPVKIPPANPTKPDVYYIILDMYGREDMLRTVYNFDNSEFLDGLRRRGFLVADKSCSNYSHTLLSLASSLNMTYLEDLGHTLQAHDRNKKAIFSMTHGNRVSRFFKSQGYRYATNLTVYEVTGVSETADVTYSLTSPWIRGEFVDRLMGSTAASLFRPNKVDYHRHALESIRDAARLEGPKFVFWHLLLPHNPFVFDRHGNVTQAAYSRMDDDDESRKQPYLDQMMFLNGKMLQIVDDILKSSRMPPIIIIQGDHGPMAKMPRRSSGNQKVWLPSAAERMPILNAYLVPDAVRAKLYPAITPVNTFRILFSELFGADLPLLPDRSFFCHYVKAIEMAEVTDQVLPR